MKLHLQTKLRILLITLLFIAVFNQMLIAQNIVIRGSVIDSVNMKPVPFATLFIKNETGTISDEQGNFTLSLTTMLLDDTIKFTSIGYSNKSLPVRLVASMDRIYLAKTIYELKSVVVQAKPQKIQKPEDIIQRAIDNINANYPSDRSIYKGYYWEYVKDEA